MFESYDYLKVDVMFGKTPHRRIQYTSKQGPRITQNVHTGMFIIEHQNGMFHALNASVTGIINMYQPIRTV